MNKKYKDFSGENFAFMNQTAKYRKVQMRAHRLENATTLLIVLCISGAFWLLDQAMKSW